MSTCKKCNAETQRTHVDGAEGASGNIRVTARNVPVEQCPSCGARQFPMQSFLQGFLQEIGFKHELRCARSKGLFHKTEVCCQCGAELRELPQTRKFTMNVLTDTTPLELQIEAPSYACMSCGTTQVADIAHAIRQIGEAVDKAFSAIEQPSGFVTGR